MPAGEDANFVAINEVFETDRALDGAIRQLRARRTRERTAEAHLVDREVRVRSERLLALRSFLGMPTFCEEARVGWRRAR